MGWVGCFWGPWLDQIVFWVQELTRCKHPWTKIWCRKRMGRRVGLRWIAPDYLFVRRVYIPAEMNRCLPNTQESDFHLISSVRPHGFVVSLQQAYSGCFRNNMSRQLVAFEALGLFSYTTTKIDQYRSTAFSWIGSCEMPRAANQGKFGSNDMHTYTVYYSIYILTEPEWLITEVSPPLLVTWCI